MSDLYESDFYAWANQQARLLREGRLSDADVQNIAEEIETLGRSEKRELVSRLRQLFLHLLKWQYQPARRANSWRVSILKGRDDLGDHLKDNPSLQHQMAEAMTESYRRARRDASVETGIELSTFPILCPWSFDEAMREDFWPGVP